MTKPILVVACVLVNEENEILLGLRQDRSEWEVPGGKVEDETIKQAFERELYEETGIFIMDEPGLLKVVEPDPAEFDGNRYVIHFMLSQKWRGFAQRLEPEKCVMWRWFNLDELPPFDKCTPGTRIFLQHILRQRMEI